MRVFLLLALMVATAGCVLPSSSIGSASVEVPATTDAEVVMSVAWEGRTATVACGPLPGSCVFVEQARGTWHVVSEMGAPGEPTRIRGTMTWTAETPATQAMRVHVFALDAEGRVVAQRVTQGTSPLAFDVDLAALGGADHALSIHGNPVPSVPAETGQSFSVRADIVSRVP